MTKALQECGHHCGQNRVARLMREAGLRPKQKRRHFCPQTTDREHARPAAENWLSELPTPERPDQVWVADITYLDTGEGWLYLAGLLARTSASRSMLDWRSELGKKRGATGSPDQDCCTTRTGACSTPATRWLPSLVQGGATASMSRPSNCDDNARMESFRTTLKTECFTGEKPLTRQAAGLQIFDYIEGFYNRRRPHSGLGYRSPLAFERTFNYNQN